MHMCKYIKQLMKVLGLFSIILLPSCSGAIGNVAPTHNCIWRDSISAQFINVKLFYPSYDCDPTVTEQFDWSPNYEYEDNIYDFFTTVNQSNDVTPMTLSWITSVYSKKCSSQTPSTTSKTLQITLDDYQSRLTYDDLIEGVHIINQCHNINLNDYKHQLVIQQHDVSEPNNSSVTGTITWVNTWLGTNESELNNGLWTFNFPFYGVRGVFVPNQGMGRYIYVGDEYGFY